MKNIYPPSYEHLWVNENSEWYLQQCFSLENLVSELNEDLCFYSFIIYEDKRVGILRYCYNTKISEASQQNAVFLHRLYLNQELHGKGLAHELMIHVEKQAVLKKNKYIWLKAMDTQMQAIRFYQKEGFETIGSERLDFKKMLRDFRGMIIMRKSLQ
ncbi:GNAT family N-acetyltransferase [Gaetbulibacter sp. M240]|uniref:GNAT family N-acetyltransferase n=1 Tax=Gaetbulibacter sp. M240 TaxID=3126511 RepID=UPI00374F846A